MKIYLKIAQSVGAVEYTNCISAEEWGPSNECSGYDINQPDSEAPEMLEHWGMRSTPFLLSLPGSLWPGVVVPDRVISIGQIELFDI